MGPAMVAAGRGPVRVLTMVTAYPPAHCAGSEVMVHALLRPLVTRGHEVNVVLSRDTGAPYELDGVRVWPHVGKADPFRFVADSDVIVCHLENTMRATTIGQMSGIPVVQVLHNDNGHTAQYLRRGGANLVVFNSTQLAERFSSYGGYSIVVRPPVDLVEYETTPGEHVTLVNLSADKGAHVFYALAERFPDRQFLGVVGAYGEQIIRDDLPNVTILPHLPAARMRDEVYARTRVLLVPSVHESWGRVGIEAMASGIPVVASPTDGLRESLGAAGIFCDPKDVDAWATELKRLGDGRKWRAASRKAKARAAELAPAADLASWCEAVEGVARVRIPARLRR